MSIFGAMGIGLLVGTLLGLVVLLGHVIKEHVAWIIAAVVSGVIVWIGTTVMIISTDTNDERVWVSNYLAQKQTIELSLDNPNLTGYERVALVTKASELNGELSKRKTEFNLWYNVHFDNTIYDGVELIDLN